MSIQVQSQCYLHYAFQEAPNGLRCSIDQTHTQSEDIELSISNTRGVNVYVKKITITFPLGADQANHMSGSSNITFNYSPSDQFTVVQQSPGMFVITPVKSGSTITWLNQGLYLRFSGIVMNTTLGVCKIKIDEQSSLGSSSSTTDQVGWFWFGKYPYEFYMSNLVADKTLVDANGSVNLSWVGAVNGNYTMKWYDATGPKTADVTATRAWQSPALAQSTVFQLVGTSTSGPQRSMTLAATVFVNASQQQLPESGTITGKDVTVSNSTVQLNCDGQPTDAFSNRSGTMVNITPAPSDVYQYFQAAASGPLAWIDIYFVSCSGAVTLDLANVSNGDKGSIPVGSVTLNPVANSWNRVVYPTAVSLNRNTKYRLHVWRANSNSSYVLGGSDHHIDHAYCSGQPQHVNVWMEVALTVMTPSGMTVTPEGLVGIATSTPTYLLDVNGTMRAKNVHESSDISLKRNIATLPDALAQLLQLRGVVYERRDSGQQEIGFVSQEVEQVFPELVQQDGDGLGAVAYGRLTAVLVEAVKTLSAEVEALRAEIRGMRD